MSLLLYDLHRLRHLPDFDLVPDEFDGAPLLGPWRSLSTAPDTAVAVKDKWSINMDVAHFSPEEITVRTSDRFVVVEGCHEERRDAHGAIARRFVRRCALPEGCLADTVQAELSSDGVLTVSAPLKLALPDEGERIVLVERTGPVLRQRAAQPEQAERPWQTRPSQKAETPQKAERPQQAEPPRDAEETDADAK